MRFFTIFYFLFMMISCNVSSQELSQKLFDQYEEYKEPSLKYQYLKHHEILPLIEALKKDKQFDVSVLGQSLEGRDIFQVKIGQGKTNVLLWSQMHGDEPTATMALMDIFNFFQQSDEFDEVREEILQNMTLYFIPMLNPDGAEKFKRRTALDIDMNRDALRLQSPESKILKEARDRTQAVFGYNLHDQSKFYSAGEGSPHPSAIAFLAPAFNYEKDINDVRERSMQLIVSMNKVLQQFIPNKVAKYNDDFEPRAFGDNIQKWGTSLILIESGGYLNDPERQFLRKLNFVAMLSSFKAIADQSYLKETKEDYFKIPKNDRSLFSVVIRNAKRELRGKLYTTDIGVMQAERHEGDRKSFVYSGSISELGDMSIFHGYEELDAKGMVVVPGKVYTQAINSMEELKNMDFKSLIEQGYTGSQFSGDFPKGVQFIDFPFNILIGKADQDNKIELGNTANFTLQKDGKVVYAVINGFLYDLKEDITKIRNGRVFR